MEKVEIAAKPQQQAKDDDLKLQQQMILDSYEQTASTQPKKVVEDVYTQYQQTGVNATFSGNKYSANGPHVERMQFESELENFRFVDVFMVGVRMCKRRISKSRSSLCLRKRPRTE